MNLTQQLMVILAAIPASIGIGIGIKWGHDIYDIMLRKYFRRWAKNVGKIHTKTKRTTKKALKNVKEALYD